LYSPRVKDLDQSGMKHLLKGQTANEIMQNKSRETQLLVIGNSDRASHALQTVTPSRIVAFVAALLHHEF
jgi:hypothetical protein